MPSPKTTGKMENGIEKKNGIDLLEPAGATLRLQVLAEGRRRLVCLPLSHRVHAARPRPGGDG